MRGLQLASVSRAAEESETLGFVDFEKRQNMLKNKPERLLTEISFTCLHTYSHQRLKKAHELILGLSLPLLVPAQSNDYLLKWTTQQMLICGAAECSKGCSDFILMCQI